MLCCNQNLLFSVRKNLLITGTTKGLGKELATYALNEGHNVIGISRSPSTINVNQNNYAHYQADVSDYNNLSRLVSEITKRFYKIDSLILNSGIYPEGAQTGFQDIDIDYFKQTIETNYLGAVYSIRTFLPLLSKAEHPSIIAMGSGAGSISNLQENKRYCYGPSKSALHMLIRTLSFELTPPKWLVAIISPGWVQTDMGGPEADLTITEVIPVLYSTISGLTNEQHGKFLDRFGKSDSYSW